MNKIESLLAQIIPLADKFIAQENYYAENGDYPPLDGEITHKELDDLLLSFFQTQGHKPDSLVINCSCPSGNHAYCFEFSSGSFLSVIKAEMMVSITIP